MKPLKLKPWIKRKYIDGLRLAFRGFLEGDLEIQN